MTWQSFLKLIKVLAKVFKAKAFEKPLKGKYKNEKFGSYVKVLENQHLCNTSFVFVRNNIFYNSKINLFSRRILLKIIKKKKLSIKKFCKN